MTNEKVDAGFIEEFKDNFIAHLKIPYDPLKIDENSAQELIAQDNPGEYGKITRVFDRMADYLPCFSLGEYALAREEAGSIEAYMKPMIDQIAALVMTKDQSKLNDEVIKAIGVDHYCRLVNGRNIGKDPEINIIANQEPLTENASEEEIRQFNEREAVFKKNEMDLAQGVLQAVLPCYSASLIGRNIPEQEQVRKNLEEIMNPLMNKIQKIDGAKGDFKFDKSIVPPSFEELPDGNYNKAVVQLIEEINQALEKQEPDRNELMNLCVKANALNQKGLQLPLISQYNMQRNTITEEITGICQNIASGKYSITDLQSSAISAGHSGKALQPLKSNFNELTIQLKMVQIARDGDQQQGTAQKLFEIAYSIDQCSETIDLYLDSPLLAPKLKDDIEETYGTTIDQLRQVIIDANPGELFALKGVIEFDGGNMFDFTNEIQKDESPFKEISTKISVLNELLDTAAIELFGTPAAKFVAKFQRELEQNISYPVYFYEHTGLAEEKQINGVKDEYKKVTERFIASINGATTYEMHALKRVLNYLTLGWAFSADKNREDKCNSMKQRLLDFKDSKNDKHDEEQQENGELTVSSCP